MVFNLQLGIARELATKSSPSPKPIPSLLYDKAQVEREAFLLASRNIIVKE
jgi:hypothetical protein